MSVAVEDEPGRGRRPDLWPSVGEYPCYDPFLYYRMSSDEVRNRAYRAALDRVAMGRRVLDIGTGQDLNWALYAARRGAASVVAIEGMDENFRRAAARLASLTERDVISLLHGWSFSVDLSTPAEVCVSEVIGSIASAEGVVAILGDARRRLMAGDATTIPHRCQTRAAAVSLRAVFPDGLGLTRDAVPYLERIFGMYGHPFDIRLAVANVHPRMLVSDHQPVETLEFDGPLEAEAECAARLTMQRAAEIDGLLLWIRLWCSPDDEPIDSLFMRTSWIPAYLPLFEEERHVEPGDVLDLVFRRTPSDDGVHPDYQADAVLMTGTGTSTARFVSVHHALRWQTHRIYRDLFGVGDGGLSDAGTGHR